MQGKGQTADAVSFSRGFKSVLGFIAAFMLLSNSSIYADAQQGVDWLKAQSQVDGAIAQSMDVSTHSQSTVESSIAIQQHTNTSTHEVNAFIQDYEFKNVENLSREVLHLNAQGLSFSTPLSSLLNQQNIDGGFGEFFGYQSTTIDTAFSLKAMSLNANVTSTQSGKAVAFMLSKQSADGGFALNEQNISSVYATAQAIQALNQYRRTFNLELQIQSAIAYIQSQNSADYWASDWETAHALMALIESQPDVTQYRAALDNLIANQDQNGSWSSDAYATAVALQTLFVAENIPTPTDPTKAAILGQVLSASDDSPLGNVNVSLDASQEVQTLADGRFSIDNLEPGTYAITYSSAGFNSVTQSVSVVAGQVLDAGLIKLDRLLDVGVLQGIVLDNDTNEPVTNAVITVTGADSQTVQTDNSGQYALSLQPGEIGISVAADGYQNGNATATVVAGTTLVFSPSLYKLGDVIPSTVTLTGSIFDVDNRLPLDGAQISVQGTAFSASSNADGSFSLEGVSAGSLSIEVSVAGYQSVVYTAIAPAGSTVTLGEVYLKSIAQNEFTTVTGRVFNEVTGDPVVNATVIVTGQTVGGITDADGYYKIEGVAAVQFSVTANAVGYYNASAQVSLANRGLVNIDFPLQQAAVSSLSFKNVHPHHPTAEPFGEVEVEGYLVNTGDSDVTAVLFYKVLDSQGNIYEVNPAQHVPIGGDPFTGHVTVVPNVDLEFEVEWYLGAVPAGNYAFVVQAYDVNTGQLLAESETDIEITSLKAAGGIVAFNPPITQLASNQPVAIEAQLQNKGNLDIDPTMVTATVTLDTLGYQPVQTGINVEARITDSQEVSRFKRPAVDSLGNQYVIDDSNAGRILRVLPDNSIEVVYSGIVSPRDIDIDQNDDIHVISLSRDYFKLSTSGALLRKVDRLFMTGSPVALEVLDNGRVFIQTTKVTYELNSDDTLIEIVKSGIGGAVDIVTGSDDSIYIASRFNNKILRYQNGLLEDYVDGITQAHGLAIDAQDNLYVSSLSQNKIFKISSSNQEITLVTDSGLSGPYDLHFLNDGQLAVSNQTGSSLVLVDVDTGAVEEYVQKTINRPSIVEYDAQNNLYVGSINNIVNYSSGGIESIPDSNSTRDIVVNDDGSIAFMRGNSLYVTQNDQADLVGSFANIYNGKIVDSPNGYYATVTQGITELKLDGTEEPYSVFSRYAPVAVTATNDDAIYVATTREIYKVNNNVYEFFADGFTNIYDLEVDANNNVHVVDLSTSTLVSLNESGERINELSLGFRPSAVAIDSEENVYVAEINQKEVYKVVNNSLELFDTFDYAITRGLEFDGDDLWVAQRSRLTKRDAMGQKNSIAAPVDFRISKASTSGILMAQYSKIQHVDSQLVATDLVSGDFFRSKSPRGIVSVADGFIVIDSNRFIYEVDSNASLVKTVTPIYNPFDLDYSANGDLLILNGNRSIVRLSAQSSFAEVVNTGTYTKIETRNNRTYLMTSTGLFELNELTNEITSVISGLSQLSDFAVAPNGNFVFAESTQNRFLTYSAAGDLLDTDYGLFQPRGIIEKSNGELFIVNTLPANIMRVEGANKLSEFSRISSAGFMYENTDGSLLVSRTSNIAEINMLGEIVQNHPNGISGDTNVGITQLSNGTLFTGTSRGRLLELDSNYIGTTVATGIGNAVDLESDGNNNVYVLDSSLRAINKIDLDANGTELLTGEIPGSGSHFEINDDKYYVVYNSSAFSVFDSNGDREDLVDGTFFGERIEGISFLNDSTLIGVTRRDYLNINLQQPNPTTEGQVVYQQSFPITSLEIDDIATGFDFGEFIPEVAGIYSVDLSFGNETNAQGLTNKLNVGATAKSQLNLQAQKVFPGDRDISSVLTIQGADSTSITRLEVDGITLAAESGATGRAIAGDSQGNIYAASPGKLVQITPDGQVSDFVTGITIGNGLAVDNQDNIYAPSGRSIIKISQDKQVTTLPTVGATVYAVTYDYFRDKLYAITGANELIEVFEDGSFEVRHSVGISSPRALTIDVFGNFYILSQSRTTNAEGLLSNPIIRITPEGQTSVYYKEVRFEFEGVNVIADCSNNLLFAPFATPPYVPGEEDSILQHIGNTGEVEKILYGPPVDAALKDIDVLYYDHRNDRVLIWTDLQSGKIFSFPVVCGGLDIEANLITRNDVDLNSSQPAPTSSIDLGDGTTQYTWLLSEVDNQGEMIDLNLLFKGLTEGETRPAFKEGYLEYTNTYAPDQIVRVPIELPNVTATSQMGLSASTDNSEYSAGSVVGISASISNEGDQLFDGVVRWRIVDSNGDLVEDLIATPINDLPGFAEINLTTEWFSESIYAGDYQLLASLENLAGTVVAESTTNFTLLETDSDGNPVTGYSATSTVTAHQVSYDPFDQVQLVGRLRNTSSNSLLPASRLEISVADAAGNIVFTDTANVDELTPDALRNELWYFNLVDAAAGEYIVQLNAIEPNSGDVMTTSVTSFTVIENLSVGLNGSVAVNNALIEAGAEQSCTYTLENLSADAVSNLTIFEKLVNLDTSEVLDTQSVVINVEGVSTFINSQAIATANLEDGGYACILQAEIDGQLVDIAGESFIVETTSIPIEMESSLELGTTGSILVLVDSEVIPCSNKRLDRDDDDDDEDDDDTCEDSDHGDDCDDDDDDSCGVNQSSEPSATLQAMYLEQLLIAQGWNVTLVNTADAFTTELRSGQYVSYGLFAEEVKLSTQVQKELREAVYAGSGLLVAGSHDNRNKHILDAVGLDVKGKHGNAIGVLATIDQAEFAFGLDETVLRLSLDGAEQLTELSLPSRRHDSDDDDDDSDSDCERDDGDDDDKDDDDCQSSYSASASTYYQFGEGQSIYFAYDLLAEATNASQLGVANPFAEELLEALQLTHPAQLILKSGLVVPVTLSVNNLGIETPARVLLTLSEGMQLQSSAGWTVVGPNTYQLDMAFAEGEEWQQLMQLILSNGVNTLDVVVQSGVDPDFETQTESSLVLMTQVMSTIDDVYASLGALKNQNKRFKSAHKHVARAKQELSRGKTSKAVARLVQAADQLNKLDASRYPNVHPVRVELAGVLRQLSSALLSASSALPFERTPLPPESERESTFMQKFLEFGSVAK